MKKQLAASLACLLLLTGCAKAPVTEDTTPTDPETTPVTSAPTAAPETVPAETEKPVVHVNPLTGEALSAPYDGSRPYAVMINNIQVAMPQCGTSHADIMYEVLAEGGVTRMMAIFSGLEGETPLGSIRSLRPYYLSIARSYDAIMVHAGASEGAYADLSNTGWDHIDGVQGANSGNYYYRVQSRIDNAGYEHSLFIDMEDAVAYAEAMDCRFQHEDYENALVFSDQPLTGGTPASQVTVHFRTSKTTSFTYDAGTKLYAGAQYGSDWADGNDGTVLEFRNLLVLYADTKTIDDYGRLGGDAHREGRGIPDPGRTVRAHYLVPGEGGHALHICPGRWRPRNSGRGQELCGGCPTRKRFGPGMTQSQTAASIPATIGMFAGSVLPGFSKWGGGAFGQKQKTVPTFPERSGV